MNSRLALLAALALAAPLLAGCAALQASAQCADAAARTGCATVTVELVSLKAGTKELPGAGQAFTFNLDGKDGVLPSTVGPAATGHHKGDTFTAQVVIAQITAHARPRFLAEPRSRLPDPVNVTVGEVLVSVDGTGFEVVEVQATAVMLRQQATIGDGNATESPELGFRLTPHTNETSTWITLEAHNGTSVQGTAVGWAPGTYRVLGGNATDVIYLGGQPSSARPVQVIPSGAAPRQGILGLRDVPATATFRITRIVAGEPAFPTDGNYGAQDATPAPTLTVAPRVVATLAPQPAASAPPPST